MRIILFAFLFLTYPIMVYAQWVQTQLNPGLGYSLFSNDTILLAGTDKGYVNAIAEVIHMGRRTSVIECSLFGRDRRLLWKGLFTCLHFPSEINTITQ